MTNVHSPEPRTRLHQSRDIPPPNSPSYTAGTIARDSQRARLLRPPRPRRRSVLPRRQHPHLRRRILAYWKPPRPAAGPTTSRRDVSRARTYQGPDSHRSSRQHRRARQHSRQASLPHRRRRHRLAVLSRDSGRGRRKPDLQ